MPVVGIGASAGGLEAFKKFFSALPDNGGAAYVLIQHLDPTRESLTAELVGTHTPMSVVQAEDDMPVEPNHVYVIPPNEYLSIRGGTLRLSTPGPPRSLRMAVDFFLHSLAEDQQENAVGIILSGTGTDGTMGMKEIKAAGGMTMVQDPLTTQHDGMPRSAIASGCADYILPAEQMGEALLEYLHGAAGAAAGLAVLAEQAPDSLAAAVDVLRATTKFDFSGYKQGTLRRRIQRRMSLMHLDNLAEYVKALRQDPAEAEALFKDLLINVTSFFREPDAWQFLQEQVIRPLVAAKDGAAALRVWVPACASGEEAYSMAMVLVEEIATAGSRCLLQVFASDVDSEALETARIGIYPEGIAAHVSPERLSRFFTRSEHGYQVRKDLRDSVVFAQQSLVSDPPFSRLDLISCRNLFIYLEPALQDQVLPLLHFALRPSGYLFMGSAEGIGQHESLFEPVSTTWRIYRRIGRTRHDRLQFPLATAPVSGFAGGRRPRPADPIRLAALAQSVLLERHAPACVIVNRTGEILYFQGKAGDYFTQPVGPPTRDLLAQARDGLRVGLRSGLRDAIRGNRRVVVPGIQMRRGDAFSRVKLTIEPLSVPTADDEGSWLVSLEDEPAPAVAPPTTEPVVAAESDRVRHLEYELKGTKEDLQQTIEDLRAANEELMSVNEEFQSGNEELETSKEELQSLNEELTTANNQLEGKIGEVKAINDDLDNLLTSTNIATLFLDTELRIRRFTPTATQLFSLIPSDIGRPIGDIAQKFADPNLLRDAAAVMCEPIAPKTEVQAHDGRWYVRQVLPYRTRGAGAEGVVVTFSDVAAEALREARLYAESIVDTVREPLLVLDGELRVRSANRAFYATFLTSPEESIGQSLYDLGKGQFDTPRLRAVLKDALDGKVMLDGFQLKASFGSIGRRVMQINARTIDRGGAHPNLMLLAIEDITDRLRAHQLLREEEDRKRLEEYARQRRMELAHALRISTVGELASGLAHELNQPLSAIVNGVDACARYVRAGKIVPLELLTLLDGAAGDALRAGTIIDHLRHFIEKGQPQFTRVDLGEIVRNVPHLLAREIRNERIELQIDVATEPLPIYADPIQIEQIIVNLIQNAIDAIRESSGERREIQLEVSVAKGTAQVAVRDSGTGVSAAASERMFEPFFTTKAHGLGMGLAISRSMIETHRGRIWVSDRADGCPGTTVRLTVPLMRPRRPAVKKKTKKRAK